MHEWNDKVDKRIREGKMVCETVNDSYVTVMLCSSQGPMKWAVLDSEQSGSGYLIQIACLS